MNLDLTLNFACNASSFRFKNGEPELLNVYYFDDHKSRYQTRLPGGTVQFVDIMDAIASVKTKTDSIESEKLELILSRIPEQEIAYNEELEPIKKDFFKKNRLFNEYLKRIYFSLSTQTSTSAIQKIAEAARIITLSRELKEETLGQNKGRFFESAKSFVGCHQKLSYVAFDVDAPDHFEGSPDDDIISSQWTPMSKLREVFEGNQSSHKVLIQSAIKFALNNKLHPEVEKLRIYSGDNN